jgi:hypothetical protein
MMFYAAISVPSRGLRYESYQPGRMLMSVTIAVVGGASSRPDYDPPVHDAATARAAAASVGRELADAGFDLVVYSSRPEFIEREVVRGYITSDRARPGSIRVLSRYGFDDADFAEIDRLGDIFAYVRDSSPDWEVSYYRSLLDIDGLVLLGGGRSTFIAGLIALSRQIALVPVACFGGGAEKAWHYMSREPNLATEDDMAKAAAGWTESSAKAVVGSIIGQRRRKAETEDRHQRERYRSERSTIRSLSFGLCLLLFSLATIPASYASRPGTTFSAALLVVAPLLSAMCGSIIRNTSEELQGWLGTIVLGAAAGSIAFLLFVAAQLATSPNILNGDGARRLLFFVIPVGFIAGLTFDAVYNKLRSQDVVRTSTLQRDDSP